MTIVTTSVVRGSHQGESHGGVYLVDLTNREVRQVVDWNTASIDWQGRGWDRGLRGIAFDGETVYIAASDELFAYSPDFRLVGSWRSPYLKHCHEIAVWDRRLFIASTGFDSVLAFDLDLRKFTWAMHVTVDPSGFRCRAYDPLAGGGPAMLNRLHLNNVHCTRGGMYISGLRTGGMLLFNGREIRLAVALPTGTHNARPFLDGVLFNDTEADALRYVPRSEGQPHRAFAVPSYPETALLNRDVDQSKVARQGFARGLCPLSDHIVAGGSSPSTISVYDLASGHCEFSINLTMDIRNAIHGLEVWPYGK